MPLGMIGGKCAEASAPIEIPCKVSGIARAIPKVPWYNRATIMTMLMGIGPFGTIFTEIYFVMDSVWGHRFYYLFGFLALGYVFYFLLNVLHL